MSWLGPVVDALDRRTVPIEVFVRDDDAGWADAELFALLDVFAARGMPIDLAVIPDALTPRLAAELLARAVDATVGLHQHGRSHHDHEVAGRKCEFGPSRSLGELRRDVAEGRRRLRELLGDAAQPVFTPPWNRCVDRMAEVLVDTGHAVLSRDASAGRIGRPGLVEVPVTVDWFGGRRGVRWTRDELVAHLAHGLGDDEPVGLMLHHGVTDADELAMIGDLVGVLASHPQVRPTTIVGVAGVGAAADRVRR